MDYLDPKKKKNKRIRLMIGYGLLGIAISIATVVFVYLANGYYIDPDGEVIQNGLIYVDTKPESAVVFLNGVEQGNRTDARLVVPEGAYSIELRRDGYLPWMRNINLEGASVRRLTYARLFPEEMSPGPIVNLPALPSIVSQSNDTRWLALAYNGNSLRMDLVDLNRSVLQLEELALPVDLLAPPDPEDPGVWDIIEWADDHRTFLAEYRRTSDVEFVLIDRTDQAANVNLSQLFADTPFTSVAMRDRKNDLLFLHDEATQTVYKANVSNQTVEPYLTNVIDYVTFGDNVALYVTAIDATTGNVRAVFKDGNEEYTLRQIQEDTDYLLELARLGNAFVMGVGSAAEGRVIVYNDPVNALRQNDFSAIPVPTTVLRVDQPEELSISSDSSIIIARGGQNFASHEFEDDRTYVFSLDTPLYEQQELRWMDGQHFVATAADGAQIVSDFEGSNQHTLTPSELTLGSIFDGPLDEQYTFAPPETEGGPPQMIRSYMRAEADR